MNFLTRVYLLLLVLLAGIALTVFLLWPAAVSDLAGSVAEMSPVLRLLAAAVVDLVLLALLFVQFRSNRRPETTGLMMRAPGAVTEVSIDSARDRILKAVSDVTDVVSVEAQVRPVRGRAEIDLDVEVLGDDVRLPDKQRDINRALKQVINKQLGLQMAGRPRVRIRLHGEKPVAPAPLPPVVERSIPAETVLPVERTPEPVIDEPPVPPPAEPERRETGGLFGGLFRSREPEDVAPAVSPAAKAEDEADMFADTPELAALLRREKPVESKPVEPPAVVAAGDSPKDDEIGAAFDLDNELADAATDELVEPAKDEDQKDDHQSAANLPPDDKPQVV